MSEKAQGDDFDAVRRRNHIAALRVQLAGQALIGLGTHLPVPSDTDIDSPVWDMRSGEASRLRAEWAVQQADAMLVALGYTAGTPSADKERDDLLLRQAQLWLEAVVPQSDVDLETTTIEVSAKSSDGSKVVASISLADTMTALQLRNGRDLTAAAKALAAETVGEA